MRAWHLWIELTMKIYDCISGSGSSATYGSREDMRVLGMGVQGIGANLTMGISESVIPAQAGIQSFQQVPDPGFRRGDGGRLVNRLISLRGPCPS
jgi:hypothetical protein